MSGKLNVLDIATNLIQNKSITTNDDFKTTLGQLRSIILSYRQLRVRIHSKNPGFLERLLG